MNTRSIPWPFLAAALLAAAGSISLTLAQPAARPGRGFGGPSPRVVSPELSADRKVTVPVFFRQLFGSTTRQGRG